MGRTANMDGTVKESPRKGSGKWIALLPPRFSDKQDRTRIPGSFENRTEALKALRKEIAELERNPGIVRDYGGKGRTIEKVVRDYIHTRSTSASAPIAAKTIRGYNSILNTCISPEKTSDQLKAVAIGNIPTYKFKNQQKENWMEAMYKAKFSASKINHAKRLLSSALNWEVSQGKMNSNPFQTDYSFKSKQSTANSQTFNTVILPTWEELANIICIAPTREDALLITLMAWTGLRYSEAISLQCKDIWENEPKISIVRVLAIREAGHWVSEVPKGGSKNTVDLPVPLWNELKALKQIRLEEGSLKAPFGNLLFRTENRLKKVDYVGVITNSNFHRDVWDPTCQAVGLGGDSSLSELEPRHKMLKIKDLRALFASTAFDLGANMAEVKKFLRHSSVEITERHYVRTIEDAGRQKAINQIRKNLQLSAKQRVISLWTEWEKLHPECINKISYTGRALKVSNARQAEIKRLQKSAHKAKVMNRPPKKNKSTKSSNCAVQIIKQPASKKKSEAPNSFSPDNSRAA